MEELDRVSMGLLKALARPLMNLLEGESVSALEVLALLLMVLIEAFQVSVWKKFEA